MAAYKAAGIDAHGYAADVSDEDAVNAMVAKIKAEVGPVDILVNNAGLMKQMCIRDRRTRPAPARPQPVPFSRPADGWRLRARSSVS